MSVLSKFDAYAMVNPKTPQDFLALLDEAHNELDNLQDHLRTVTKQLNDNQPKNPNE